MCGAAAAARMRTYCQRQTELIHQVNTTSLGMTSIWGRGEKKKKKSLTRVWSWRQGQSEAEGEGRHGDHVCTSGDERSRIWPRLSDACIYARAAIDVLSSVAPKLRTGSPLLHRGSQSCRGLHFDCRLLYVGVREARCGSGAPMRRVLIVSLGSHLYLCHLG